MPIEPAAPTFPRHETLLRFFRMPPDALVALSEVAELLGTTASTLRAMLRDDGAQRLDGSIPWTEAAAYVLDAWPRARILDALGSGAASLIPEDFHLTLVDWPVPIFILRAMEHQAAASWRNDPRVRRSLAVNPADARGVADYVADLLYNEIQPTTLAAFRDDRSFLRAFHYPIVD
jgi:hypothetical protein